MFNWTARNPYIEEQKAFDLVYQITAPIELFYRNGKFSGKFSGQIYLEVIHFYSYFQSWSTPEKLNKQIMTKDRLMKNFTESMLSIIAKTLEKGVSIPILEFFDPWIKNVNFKGT